MSDLPREVEPDHVTLLLAEWTNGNEAGLHRALESVYAELHKIAGVFIHNERKGHTLQPTALVHEAYLRLAQLEPTGFENRKQFLALAAKLMRQVLVDHARKAKAGKRGSGATLLALNEKTVGAMGGFEEFLALDEALTQLAQFSPRKAEIVNLRHFCGLSVVEAGEVLGISAPTVSREQRLAEAWLGDVLNKSAF